MANIPGNVEWVGELIPDLDSKRDQFVVDTEEVDDELVEVFIEEIRRLTQDLQTGMQQGDAELIRMSAHSIKGMGGTLGLPEISVLGLEIENAAKAQQLADAAPMVDGLARWIDSIG